MQVAHAALERAEELAQDGTRPRACSPRAREAYELRIARLEASLERSDDEHGDRADAYRRVRQQLLEAEREALDELSRTNEVRGADAAADPKELDLEETRLSR